jgi:hypothetical protein
LGHSSVHNGILVWMGSYQHIHINQEQGIASVTSGTTVGMLYLELNKTGTLLGMFSASGSVCMDGNLEPPLIKSWDSSLWTPRGVFVTANKNKNADVFVALKGSCGIFVFGIVTKLYLQLSPCPRRATYISYQIRSQQRDRSAATRFFLNILPWATYIAPPEFSAIFTIWAGNKVRWTLYLGDHPMAALNASLAMSVSNPPLFTFRKLYGPLEFAEIFD